VIIDLERFVVEERPYWSELESLLNKLASDPAFRMDLDRARRLHYLYQRASADLAKVMTFSAEPEMHRYLEGLVGRAYGEVHQVRTRADRFTPMKWVFRDFPQAFRRRARAFYLSVAITLAGCLFGGMGVTLDPDAKAILLPYEHLLGDPSERVALEEKEQARNISIPGRKARRDPLAGQKAQGTSFYFTHNTKVAVTTFALGITWGIGPILILFANGVLLGAVVLDYIVAGETVFLMGWLMPHGVIEIPAILIAGQAGLVLGYALIGWGSRAALSQRLRAITPDLVILVFGVAGMLAWAGFIEAFLSQYHEPIVPYAAKIGLGCVEFVLLILYLTRSGRTDAERSGD
jgi:uncharacterized membrane protein SpoIIM required for sporulation